MRSALFWNITQSTVAIPYRRFGKPIGPASKGEVSWHLIFVNNQIDAQFFFMYVYFYYPHVSDSHVSITRRIPCINCISSPDDGHIAVRNM